MQASSEHYDLYSPNLNFWVTRQVTQIMRASLRTLWFVQSQPQFLGHPPGDPNHAGFPRNIMICTVATSIFRSPKFNFRFLAFFKYVQHTARSYTRGHINFDRVYRHQGIVHK